MFLHMPGILVNLARMLSPGDRLPDLTLFGIDAEPVPLLSLGAVLIAFYLYDWTGT
jgi:hypothetical protein